MGTPRFEDTYKVRGRNPRTGEVVRWMGPYDLGAAKVIQAAWEIKQPEVQWEIRLHTSRIVEADEA